MRRLINPLGLEALLKGANSRAGWVPWVDCLLIGLGFTLLGSMFLFAPGVEIQLPSFRGPLSGVPVASVLSIRSGNMVIFEDAVFTEQGLEAYLAEEKVRRDRAPAAVQDRGVMLVQVDKDVSVQVFLRICEIAYASGFSKIQIAAVEQDAGEGGGW